MPYFPILLSPGINTDSSDYAIGKNAPSATVDSGDYITRGGASPGYVDGENVIWINGQLTKRLGKAASSFNCNASDGIPRDLVIWQSNIGETYMAIGTVDKLLILYNDTCYDITPTGLTKLGTELYSAARGFGVGVYGKGAFGTIRPESDITADPTQWSLAVWGEDLIAVLNDDKILYWDLSDGVNKKAVELSSLQGADHTPLVGRVCAVTTPDRHLMIGGCDPLDPSDTAQNKLQVRFGSQASLTDFHPDNTDTAGGYILEEGSEIISMTPIFRAVMVGTNNAMYRMRYIGTAENTYLPELVGTSCGPVSKNSVIEVDGIVYWMADNGFYRYAGQQAQELTNCTVKYETLDLLNKNQQKLVFAAHNSDYNLISWYFPIDDGSYRFVSYNYAEGYWTKGVNEITCWADKNGIFDTPISFDRSGQMYNENTGTTDNGMPLNAWAETAPFEVGSGNELMFIQRFVPDWHEIEGDVNIELKGRKFPNKKFTGEGKRFVLSMERWKRDVKLRARQARFRIDSDYHFQMGLVRMEAVQDGEE